MENENIEKESKMVSLEKEENKSLTSEQEEKLEKAKAEFEEFKESIENKKYSVNIKSKENLENLTDFITTKAKWKFTQSLGIMETNKSLRAAEIKSGAIFLKSVEVEAIYYFLSQHEGVGLKEAETFYGILKPINDALGSVREDNEKSKQLEQKVVAAEQGLELDTSVEKNSDSPK